MLIDTPSPRCCSKFRLLGAATVFAAGAGPLAADTQEMCAKAAEVMPDANQGCECALDLVAEDITADEMEFYTAVGAVYFENLSRKMPMAEAWDDAARTVGAPMGMSLVDVLKITNPIGALHQAALKTCG